ncbi:MAG: hypothetical protein M1812_003652 [Candelaria pacifica]|nr:MAG: hypothetical protein M1812_003652 [Candelaria pacifica]
MTLKFADRGRLADMEALYRELKVKSPSSTPTPKPAFSMTTFENRLTSFTKWPHHHLLPAEMAAAGFYHEPTASIDYVTCFHCDLQLDGWSNDDKPFIEHTKRSPECLWIRKVAPSLDTSEKPASKQPESTPPPPPSFPCRRCNEAFPSNNQLHRHIRSSRHFDRAPPSPSSHQKPAIQQPYLPATPPATSTRKPASPQPNLPLSPLKTPPSNGFTAASPRLPPRKPASQQRPYTHYDKPMGHSNGTQCQRSGQPLRPPAAQPPSRPAYSYSTATPSPPASRYMASTTNTAPSSTRTEALMDQLRKHLSPYEVDCLLDKFRRLGIA